MTYRYAAQIDRLAERFITHNLESKSNTVIAIDDLMAAYVGYSYNQTIPIERLIEKIQTRFPGCEFDIEKKMIKGIDWIRPKPKTVKKAVEYKIKMLRWRLESFLHLYSRDKGFTALEFANFRKESILSGRIIIEWDKISLDESLEFLNNPENSQCEKNGNYFIKVVK
ncbi:MAG TPA: hypothetical protein DCX03_01625 [Bacteroidales bacterium]|nr:hypothetical protein [Bacteroidales bacterium]